MAEIQTAQDDRPDAGRRMPGFGRIVAALAVLTTLLVSTGQPISPASADHGGDHPLWECDGTPILMQGGSLYRIVPDPAVPGNLTTESIPGTAGLWNSTAYNPITNHLYGVGTISGVKTIRSYDANGDVIFETPILAPYPSGANVYAGTVLGDGRYIIHSVGTGNGSAGWYNGNRFNIWSVDPVTGVSTHIASTVNLADIAYNPLDGYVYHITNRVLYKINPNDGSVTSTAMPTAFPNGGFGASWFDASGFLYVFRNNPGDIFRVDVNDTSTWREVGEVGAGGGTDGASCVSQVDMTKDVVDNAGNPILLEDRTFAPGSTFEYAFTLINNGVPTLGLLTELCDTLPAPFTYTGTWSSTHGSAAITSGGGSGDTSFCLDIEVPSSLWTDPDTPGQDPPVVTFEVQIPASATPGTYENQSTLDIGRDGDIDLLSDDPGDGSEPRDPTTVDVTGSFTVTKTVAGHPDGPTTDSFTMTVTCTNADTSAHPVAASDIVDNTTGTAWPGAGAGTFTIEHGDVVRIEGVPAGATCTTTETVPAAYDVTASSSDGTAVDNTATVVVDGAPGTETTGFTNRTGVLTIDKTTEHTSSYPLDEDGSFSFDVSCDTGHTGTYNLSTSSTAGSLTYPDTPLLPDGSICTITENVPAGWTTLDPNPVQVTIATAGPAEADFRNTRQLADLTISKAILGLPSTADPTSFTFSVDVVCTGPFDPDPFTVPGPLTIATDSPLVIPDLPVGAECTVTEAPAAGYTTLYDPGQTVTIDADGETVGITNTTGSLIVFKETTANSDLPVDLVGSFDFQITCTLGATTVYDETHTLVTDGVLADSNVGSIGWGDLPLIPAGAACVVTEVPQADWTRIEPAGTGSISLEVTVENPEPTAVFGNQRNVADLTVTKAITGAPAEWALGNEPFTVDIDCTGDFTGGGTVTIADQVVTDATDLVISGIPTGADCTVVEEDDPRFSAAYSPVTGTTNVPDAGATVDITNTTSTLSLTKTLTATSAFTLDLDDTFAFNIVCVNGAATIYSGTASITTSGGSGSAAVLDLPLVAPGSTCTVTEQGPPAGWTLTGRTGGTTSGAAGIEVTTAAGTNALGFTNDRDTETLTVLKDVTGTPVTPDIADDDFTVDITCVGDFDGGSVDIGPSTVSEGSPVQVTELPTGSTCTVTETVDPRFTTTYEPADAVTVVDGPGPTDNRVTVVNTATTISITKNTLATAGSEQDGTFDFAVTCRNPAGDTIHTGTFSITTVTGTGTWSSPDSPLLPIGAECDVTEQTPPTGWSIVGDGVEQLTTSDTETVSATFTNSRDVAELTIDKTLVGIPPALNFDTEPFTVDVSCTGPVSPSPLEFLDQTVTSVDSLVIPDIPTGAICTITEDPDSRFQTLYSPANPAGDAAVVTIETGGTSAGIVNAGGAVIIAKETFTDSDQPVDLLGSFDYLVDCTNGLNQTFTLEVDQMTGDRGVGVLTYTELPVLPDGTVCTITETVPTGWTVTTTNPQTLTVSSAEIQTASFINRRDVGDLTVEKVLDGVPAAVDLSDEPFTVDVVCTGDYTGTTNSFLDQTITENTALVIEGVPTGSTCTATETADPRFTATYTNNGATQDTDGETITVTNTTSTVSITKTTSGAGSHPLDLDDTFEFTIDCGGDEVEVTLTTSGQSGSWTGDDGLLVPPGTSCQVTEEEHPQWLNTGDETVTVITAAAAPVDAAFTNSLKTGDLAIGKLIEGLPAGVDLDAENFDVTISCSGGFTVDPYVIGPTPISVDTPINVADLPVGAQCLVTEAADGRFATSYDPGQLIAIDEGELAVDILNATSSFTIDKTIQVTGTQPIDLSANFDFDVTCTDGSDFSITVTSVDGTVTPATYPDVPLLADGTSCTVTEQTPPTGWSVVGAGSQTVELAAVEDDQQLTFTNRRTTGPLTISKSVLGAPTGLDPDSQVFTVDISCTGDFDDPFTLNDVALSTVAPITIDDLPTGAVCTIVEDPDDRFTATYTPAVAGGGAAEVTIVEAGSSAGIINSTGEIMVVKVTQGPAGHPIDLSEDFTFRVDCGSVHDQTYTLTTDTVVSATSSTDFIRYDDLPALPEGTDCTITETGTPTGWTVVGDASVDLTVDADGVQTATFVNQRDAADLTINKALVGVPTGIDLTGEPFTVDLTCTGEFTVGSYTIADQVIRATTPLVIEDLPTGTTCTAAEDADARFATSYSGPATLDDDGEAITVTNTTSTLSISKQTQGPATHPLDLDATFDFEIDCGAGVLDASITTVGQTGTWSAGDQILVPPGTVCDVTEADLDGWTNAGSETVSVTTDDAAIVDAAFTNTRDTGDLSIIKVIEGLPAGADLDAELFDVTISCSGGFTVDPYEIGPVTVSIDDPINLTDLPTDAECRTTEADDARFTISYNPGQLSTIGDDPVAVEITNSTSSFVIDKVVRVAGSQPIDLTADFTFDGTCDNGTTFTVTVPVASGVSTAATYPEVPLLAAGTSCTVTEQTPPTGWSTVGLATQTVRVTADGDESLIYTNERDVADLVVNKTLLGIPPGLDFTSEVFNLDLTCTGTFITDPLVLTSQPVTATTPLIIEDLPTGATCTVTEQFDSRFQTMYSPENATGDAAEVTIEAGGSAAGVTNAGGAVIIRKDTVTDSDHPIDLFDDFDYLVDCSNGHSETYTLTVDAMAGDQGIGIITEEELPILPNGTVCTITETVPDQWTVTTTNPQTLTVSSTDIQTASFANQRNTGTLTVDKTLVGVPTGVDLSAEPFTVDVTCSGEFTTEPYTIADLTVTNAVPLDIAGLPTDATCNVVETPDPRFSVTYTDPVVMDGDGESITVTNTTSTLAVDKTTVAPTTHPIALDETFYFDVVCQSAGGDVLFDETVSVTTATDGSGAWSTPDTPLLSPGSACEIQEQPDPLWQIDSEPVQDLTTTADEVATVQFVNSRVTSSFAVSKSLAGVPDGLDLDAEPFELTVTCTGDFDGGSIEVVGSFSVTTPLVIEELPTDAECQAVETWDQRFATTYEPVTGSSTVDGDQPAAVTVTNTTSVLVIVKTAAADSQHPIDLESTFQFEVVCDDGTSGIYSVTTDIETADGREGHLTWEQTGLHPPGTVCTVTEVGIPDGWSLGSAETLSTTLEPLPLPVQFDNLRDTAVLTVTKELAGLPSGADLGEEPFTVQFDCLGDFTDGSHQFTDTVTADQQLEVAGLPTAATCTVTEVDDERFTPTYEPPTADGNAGEVVIDPDGSNLMITNTTGLLAIEKSVTIDSSLPVTPNGDFQFTLDCDNGTEHTVEVTTGGADDQSVGMTGFEAATATAAYPDVPLLADGTTCDVTELALSGWQPVDGDGSTTVTVDGDAVSTVSFRNQRSVGALTVTKQLVDAPGGVSDESFAVTATCTGDFQDGSTEISGSVSVDEALIVDGVPTGSSCVVSEQADDRFEVGYVEDRRTVTITDDGGTPIGLINTWVAGNRSGGGSDLAFTGTSTRIAAGVGASLLIIGLAAVVVGRRRRADA